MNNFLYYSSGQSCLDCKWWDITKCNNPHYKSKWNLKFICPGYTLSKAKSIEVEDK